MTKIFEAHERPNQSRLEKFKSEIVAMRSRNWPYRKIVGWLGEQQLPINKETLRRFCLSRNITKGGYTAAPTENPTKSKPEPKKKIPASKRARTKKVFEYEEGPIPVHD